MSVNKQPQQSVFCNDRFLLRVIQQNMTTTAAATVAAVRKDHINQEIIISGLMLPVSSVLTI